MSDDERNDLKGMVRTLITRMENDAKNRDDWRKEIKDDINALKIQIAPVVRDHQIIFIGGKWLMYLLAGAWASVKAWFTVTDRLGK